MWSYSASERSAASAGACDASATEDAWDGDAGAKVYLFFLVNHTIDETLSPNVASANWQLDKTIKRQEPAWSSMHASRVRNQCTRSRGQSVEDALPEAREVARDEAFRGAGPPRQAGPRRQSAAQRLTELTHTQRAGRRG